MTPRLLPLSITYHLPQFEVALVLPDLRKQETILHILQSVDQVPYCIVQYCTVLYCAVLYCVLYCTVLYCIAAVER